MLTIYLYKNVPLQEDNKNVILFSNENDVLSYLSQYQDGVITNVNKFFSNERFIDLSLMYEGCNYMCIYDDRSVKEYKFFFIDNAYFVSGSTVRYEITLDVWATYSYNVTLKPSQLVCGHLDAIVTNEDALTTKRSLRMELNGDCTTTLYDENVMIPKFSITKSADVIALVKRIEMKDPLIFCCHVSSYRSLSKAFYNLQTNKFIDIDNNEYTFEIQKVYVINGYAIIDNLQQYDYYGIQIPNVAEGLSNWYKITFGAQNNSNVPFKDYIYNGTLFPNDTTFTAKTNKLKYDYYLGTYTNNEKIRVNSETNAYCRISLNIIQKVQVAIYLECNGIKLNITNDFEVPFINDNYTLYMAQNQATIEASNRANMSQLGMSLASSLLAIGLSSSTGGISLMAGVGMLSSTSNYMAKQESLNARLSDLKKQPNRTDALYSGGLMTLLNGCGLFKLVYTNIEDVNEDLNLYGTIFTYTTNVFITPRNDVNFYFLQFNNVNVQGYFTNSIKTKFEAIFNNGVRIWKDKTNFLNQISYK